MKMKHLKVESVLFIYELHWKDNVQKITEV